MTSQRVERMWIRTGGYGQFRGKWVNPVFRHTWLKIETQNRAKFLCKETTQRQDLKRSPMS